MLFPVVDLGGSERGNHPGPGSCRGLAPEATTFFKVYIFNKKQIFKF